MRSLITQSYKHAKILRAQDQQASFLFISRLICSSPSFSANFRSSRTTQCFLQEPCTDPERHSTRGVEQNLCPALHLPLGTHSRASVD